MDPDKHQQLDKNNNPINWLEREVVKKRSPKYFKAAVKQCSKRSNPCQCSVINATDKPKLFIRARHIIPIKFMAYRKQIQKKKCFCLSDLNDGQIFFGVLFKLMLFRIFDKPEYIIFMIFINRSWLLTFFLNRPIVLWNSQQAKDQQTQPNTVKSS